MPAESDLAWATRLEAEAAAIRGALGDIVVEIEHVGGSAAVEPTGTAIAVGATTIELPPSAVARMEALGYAEAAPDAPPGERRFRKGHAIVRVVEWGGPAWSRLLRFGDSPRAFVLSGSPAETERAAARLARGLVSGDVVTVSGELGSGKTTFVRGACRSLGVTGPVTSPTFTVGHRYGGDGVEVSHLDLYRFTAVSSAEWGDLEPYFTGAIAFVEWPEAAGESLGPVRAVVRLAHVDPTRRAITVEADEVLLATVSSGC